MSGCCAVPFNRAIPASAVALAPTRQATARATALPASPTPADPGGPAGEHYSAVASAINLRACPRDRTRTNRRWAFAGSPAAIAYLRR